MPKLAFDARIRLFLAGASMTSRTFYHTQPYVQGRLIDQAIHKAFFIPLLAQEAGGVQTYLGGRVMPIFKLVMLYSGRRGWNGEDQKAKQRRGGREQ